MIPRLLPALILLLMPIAEAMAQGGGPGMIRPNPTARPQAGAAPALPGLAGRRGPAPIEASPEAASLSPNEALFDAVGRGDLAAAREAVSRGADLRARNALGLTALDTAVDQGRNEIVFFLLSARESGGSGGPPPDAGQAALTRPRAAPAPRQQRQTALAAPAPQAPRTARLWAGDGGAARPEIGFLGFDAGRPAGAAAPAEPRARRG
ncbi:ankyrin repeat domain-containing protein [Nostoc sp. CHAB 5836]|nr:ankyrin repeat domain-containing protein [Nostoc sp. CHAB 5836]